MNISLYAVHSDAIEIYTGNTDCLQWVVFENSEHDVIERYFANEADTILAPDLLDDPCFE